MEQHDPQLGISRFIAINPPVSTGYALRRIDELLAVSSNWTKTEMRYRLTTTAGQLMMKLEQRFRHFDPDDPRLSPEQYHLPLDRDSARYLAGLSMKLSLRDLLFSVHRDTPLEGLPE